MGWKKGDRKEDRLKFMPKRAVAALLRTAKAAGDDRAHLAFSLSFFLGLREGEVADLHRKDFDLKSGRLWVRTLKRKDRPALAVQVPGNGWAHGAVLTALRLAVLHPSGLVFPAPGGRRPLSTRWFRLHFDRHRRAAGLPAYTFHSLRHAHATLIAQSTRDPVFVRDQLRHRSVTTTDIYMRNTKDYRTSMGNSLSLEEGSVPKPERQKP